MSNEPMTCAERERNANAKIVLGLIYTVCLVANPALSFTLPIVLGVAGILWIKRDDLTNYRTNEPMGHKTMRTYIELRRDGHVKDWRVIIDDNDATVATVEAIAEKARELTWHGMAAGDTILVYESEMTADQLKLRR
jgi:hypothetical protein